MSPLDDLHRSAIVNFLPGNPEAVKEVAKAEGIIVSVREGGVRVSPSFYNSSNPGPHFDPFQAP